MGVGVWGVGVGRGVCTDFRFTVLVFFLFFFSFLIISFIQQFSLPFSFFFSSQVDCVAKLNRFVLVLVCC